MKVLIIYISIHYGNTERIAKAMAEVLNAELVKPSEIEADSFSKYDLIGFGSGSYFWRHHRGLLSLVKETPRLNKKAFIFSTRGAGPAWLSHRVLKKTLLEKGFDVIGEFSCKGFDTFGALKLIGGINKGKPDEKDLGAAKKFAVVLKERIN
ncbi:flavodoxin family protein [Chloroflexota bacterium]